MGATLFEVLRWVWGAIIVGIGLNWFTDIIKWTSLQNHPWWAGAGFLLLAGGTGWSYRDYRRAEAVKHFDLFKEAKDILSSDLDFQKQKPGEELDPDYYRPFNETYIPRKAEASNAKPNTASVVEEPTIVNFLRNGEGLVFIGPPGAGKTRTLFSLLRNLGPCIVLRPTRGQPLPPNDAFRILKGRHPEALTAYERALELQPDYAGAWGNKGGTLHALGRYPEALTAYERALELQPDLAEAWRQVTRLAAAQGDLVKAEKARLEVLRLEREQKEKKS